MTRSLLISPHDDDSVLFSAYTCARQKPLICVVTDSHLQPARGEFGCDISARAHESYKAHAILGCDTKRLSIPDDNVTEDRVISALREMDTEFDVVYAPALQGGNEQHDAVSRAADRVFGSRVVHYTTYTREQLYTTGNVEIVPTAEELRLKREALYCFESQLRVNMPHFAAVIGKSEWLMEDPRLMVAKNPDIRTVADEDRPPVRLHLGCGRNILPGYINIDRHPYEGVDRCWDLLGNIPYEDSSVDYVVSQDFLEHLPPESKVSMINEIWRVLKPGGIMEHNVPNAGSMNDFGSPTHLSHWSLQQFDHWNVDSYRYDKDREFEWIVGGFRKIVGELVNFKVEEDGVKRAQSIHVKFEAVKE